MTFLGLAWVVSYIGSFYAPQAFLNSIHQLFANSNSATPQPSTEQAIVTSASAASLTQGSGSLASGSLLRWLPRPERARALRTAATPLAITVAQSPQVPQVNVAEPAKTAGQPDKPSPLQIFRQCIPSGHSAPKTSSRSSRYQVQIKGQAVAELPTRAEATKLARRFREVLEAPGFNPLTLQPTRANGRPAGKAGQRSLLFTIDSVLEAKLRRNADLVAIDWINNLRTVMGVAPLPLVQAQTQLYELSSTGRILAGTASWYGPYFHNRLTAAGERFDQYELTAAHPSLPFDTYLKVTNQKSGNSVIVRINDRGPYVGQRSLDLSRQAARCIGSETVGVVPYSAVIMQPTEVTELDLQASFSPVSTTTAPAHVSDSPILPSSQRLASLEFD